MGGGVKPPTDYNLKRAGIPWVLFLSPFLVSPAKKRETSPDTTGITSEDESKGVTET